MITVAKPNGIRQAIVLRDATLHDVEAINDIFNYYVLHATCTYQIELSSPEERYAWFYQHDSSHPVIVAEWNGEVIGWAALSKYKSRKAYRFTVEDSLYIKPDFQGRGLGSQLLGELIQRAEHMGYRSIIACISHDQIASIKLHEKFGFTKVAHLHQVGYKFNRWHDAVYYQLLLGNS